MPIGMFINSLVKTHDWLNPSHAPAPSTQVPVISRLPALEPDGGTDLLKFITWAYANFPASANEPPPNDGALRDFTREYERATRAEHLQAFEDGYHDGKPEDIEGYKPGMTVERLLGLSLGIHSPAHIGTLSRLITQRILQSAPKRQWSDNAAPSTPSQAQPSALRLALDKQQTLQGLGQKLNEIVAQLGSEASPQSVQAALKAAQIAAQPHSSSARSLSLDTFITRQGLTLPTHYTSLVKLAQQVNDNALAHPLGNLGGALSWPVPLSADEQARLATFTQTHTHHLGNKPTVATTQGGVLEFLRYQLPLWSDTLNHPAKLLDALLDSPQARAMGKALRENMQGLATESSDTDFLLAAINLQLDPASATAFDRNKVAGFDLASPEHFGKPLSTVVERLQQHLIDQGKSSQATAGASAHLLLASRAPVYLVKDIPSNVTYGSPAWLNLVVAVATLEAQTPGKVANMTFAQVMHDAQAVNLVDKTVSENAQTAALLDWGAANGVMAKKHDSLYTPDDLKTLIDTFNTRVTQMMSATQALDTALPSRKEMALAELKQRFPGHEALFEVKAIKVLQRYYPDNGAPARETVVMAGEHSMLDIAMMSSKDRNLVFRSSDSRLPIKELNANKRFTVLNAFEAELAKGIEAKKKAVGTSIQHLIAQLPLEDRQNFELGEVSFFQKTAYQLGKGAFSTTPLPTDKELMVSITRNGKTTAYAIDLDKGSITHALPWQAAAYEKHTGSRVDKTQAFAETLPAQAQPQASDAPSDSFVSPRTLAIADTFVKHLNLDSQDIKDHAKGLTTDELRDKKIANVVNVVLDVIPFRSAIVNFQKGNVGDGVYDLAVDLFGFLTAGAGTVGKAVKIGSTALSTATKAYKVAKTIGAATISALNPLDGVGDLAVGAVRLAGNGLKQIGAKALQGVNKLRGATGSYDLLHAVSKEHGPTLIGNYKVGDLDVEGAAVLKDNRWYKYDHVANKPYGLPIEDFYPLGAPLLRAPPGSTFTPDYMKLFNNLSDAKTPANLPAFNKGFSAGSPQTITDYHPQMNSRQLRELAERPNRPPFELGVLARELRSRYVINANYATSMFKHDVQGPGTTVNALSQGFYNAHADLPSLGECAGLTYAMAVAIQTGKQDQLLNNMRKVTENVDAPAARTFINELRSLQDQVTQFDAFHNGNRAVMRGAEDIIEDLSNASASMLMKIASKDHALLAGAKIENGQKQWFFYDPNGGLATFTTPEAMQKGIRNVLNTGKTAAVLNTERSPFGARLFGVSKFELSDLTRPGIDPDVVRNLSNVPL